MPRGAGIEQETHPQTGYANATDDLAVMMDTVCFAMIVVDGETGRFTRDSVEMRDSQRIYSYQQWWMLP